MGGLLVQAGGVGLGPTEVNLLGGHIKLLPGHQVVDPTLGDDEAAARTRLAVTDDGHGRLILILWVARAVDETGHVQALAVDESGGFPGHAHPTGDQGHAGVPLGLPHQVLLVVGHPQQQLLLGALGLTAAAVDGLHRVIRLEVAGNVVGQVGQKGGAEPDDEVDPLGVAVAAAIGNSRLDCPQIGAVTATEVDIPLVFAHFVENCRLAGRHCASPP